MGFQIDNERNETTIYFKDLAKFETFRFPSSTRETSSYKIKIPQVKSCIGTEAYNTVDFINLKLMCIEDGTIVVPVDLSIKEV